MIRNVFESTLVISSEHKSSNGYRQTQPPQSLAIQSYQREAISMLLVCPHCRSAEEYQLTEIHVFVRCKGCSREFRPAESPPLIGRKRPQSPRGQFPALGRNPLNPDEAGSEWLTHSRKAHQLYKQRRYEEAEKELRASLSLNPNQPREQTLLRRIQALKSAGI